MNNFCFFVKTNIKTKKRRLKMSKSKSKQIKNSGMADSNMYDSYESKASGKTCKNDRDCGCSKQKRS